MTHNRCSTLLELLISVKAITGKFQEVIIIDNCSTDNTGDMIRNDFPEITYIPLQKNIGASARNIGLKHSAADIIITLDDDVIGLNDNSIDYVAQLFENNPSLGAVNFQIRDYFTSEICNWVHHKKEEDYAEKEFSTYEITEGAVAFRKSALEKAGYYADEFFLSHEGPDLAYRILDRGYEIAYSGKVSVRHRHEMRGRKSWYNYYYDTRNLFLLAARNFPLNHALKYVARGMSVMMIYSVRDGFFLYWLKGIKDGISGIKGAMRDRKVLNVQTMHFIKSIDKNQPNIIYLLSKRFFKKSARL